MSGIIDFNKKKDDIEFCKTFSKAAEILSKPSNISHILEDHIYKNDLMREYPSFFLNEKVDCIGLYYKISKDLLEHNYTLGVNQLCLAFSWVWWDVISDQLPVDDDLPEFYQYDENASLNKQIEWNMKIAEILKNECDEGRASEGRAQACIFMTDIIHMNMFDMLKQEKPE